MKEGEIVGVSGCLRTGGQRERPRAGGIRAETWTYITVYAVPCSREG